jgi:hypothetical protein
MLDNPLLTTVGSLIGVSGTILSYIMVRVICSLDLEWLKQYLAVRGDEQIDNKRSVWWHWHCCTE